MKKTIIKNALLLAATACSYLTGFSQTDLGASCGCPPVATRPTVDLSTKATYVGLPNDYELNATLTILSCDTTYILDHKIYIPNGKTLFIAPGTVIKGTETAVPADATALIAAVGGKLIAQGSESCPIVFTANADPLDGSYSITNRGKWGGVVLLGRASNNLTLAANNTAGGAGRYCVGADGVGFLEGYNSANGRNQCGKIGGTFDDNDNSGILSYVSIRHAGAILSVGNEVNSLTLGSVGRGTKIDHIEIVSGDDDAIEFFGGTVNVKYASVLFGADDAFDWDWGYSGKLQFLFNLNNSDTTQNKTTDNGIEADSDDQKSNNTPFSHPIIYNATFVGNLDAISNGDNSSLAAINAKERTEGEIYNSVFARYFRGLNLVKSLGTRAGSIEAYHNWTGGQLRVECNTFVGCTSPLTVGNNGTIPSSVLTSDTAKFYTTDKNLAVSSVVGFNTSWVMNGTTNQVTTTFDATANPALATSCTAPNDGFFTPASYRGAFGGSDNWLKNWTYLSFLHKTAGKGPVMNGSGLLGCFSDINGDGNINNADFLELLGDFNKNCD